MSDLIFLAVILGFFAVAFGLLRACEHIIGPETTTPSATSATTTTGAAATAADPLQVSA